MIISCPACSAQFRAGADQIGPKGRKVRCGQCAHEWHQDPVPEDGAAPAADPDASAAAPSDDAPSDDGPSDGMPADDGPADGGPADAGASDEERDEPVIAPPPIRRVKAGKAKAAGGQRGTRLWAGWLIFLVVVGGLAAGLWFGRPAIIEAMPRAAKLYALVGLGAPRPGEGLLLENVRSVRRLVGEEKHLFVQGEVVNGSDAPRTVPDLQVVFIDNAGRELQAWTFKTAVLELQAGESTAFQTSTSNPPEGAANLTVDFVVDP